MDTILTGNIWKQIASNVNKAPRRFAAVAYVSSTARLNFRKGDVLICDASDRAIKSAETSAKVLRSLMRKGVDLYSMSDLHAKVVLFGKTALVGSCNLSISSAEELTELAILTDRKQLVAQATAFLYGLREISRRIDRSFLTRISKIKVNARRRRRRRKPPPTTKFGNKVWIVSVKQLEENKYPKEQPFVQKAENKARQIVSDKSTDVSWIRWTGKSKFRSHAREGDIVIQIWESLSGKRVSVFEPCPIVLRQDVHHWTRFYVAEPDDCKYHTWDKFRKEAKRLGITSISKSTIRELRPREVLLIEQLWNR